MPRGARLDTPGTLHHVLVRGIEQGSIVRDDSDRVEFLRRYLSGHALEALPVGRPVGRKQLPAPEQPGSGLGRPGLRLSRRGFRLRNLEPERQRHGVVLGLARRNRFRKHRLRRRIPPPGTGRLLALPRQIRLPLFAALVRGFQSGQRFPWIPAGVAGAGGGVRGENRGGSAVETQVFIVLAVLWL